MLIDRQKRFMTRLRDNFEASGGWARCAANPPGAIIQDLVEKGYCKLSPARSGPLGLLTGEVMVALTDEGRAALHTSATPDAIPRASTKDIS